MASVITPPAITRLSPRTSEAAARRAGTNTARRLASWPTSILDVWRDALTAFSADSVAMLLCALSGFAMPAIIGQWIAMQAVLANYAWVGPVVTLSERPSVATLLVLTVFGLFGSSFARGVVTWLALTNMRRTCSEAIRVTFARYPALLAGSLVYGAFALACMLSISTLIHGVLPVWSGLSRAGSDVSHQFIRRGVNLLAPDLGSPFAESLPALAPSASQQAAQVTQYEQWLAETQGESALAQSRKSSQSRDIWLVSMVGLALLVLVEPLLRFRTIMAFKPSRSRQVPELPGGVGPRRFAAFAPLFDGARFGLRHFGVVTLHIWVVRSAIFALCLGLVEFPLALMDNFIMPHAIRLVGKTQLLPMLHFAQLSAATLAGAFVLAFGIVYDARLCVALGGYDVMPDVVRKVPSAELATDPPM